MGMSGRLLRPRATGFNPKSISGIALWLDAADTSTVTLNSGFVSEWRDKTVGSKFVQTTANNRPGQTTINGRNALLFDGSNDTLQCVDPFTAYPFSFFIVQRVVAYTSFGMHYAIGSSTNFNLRQFSTAGNIEVESPGSTVRSNSVLYSTSAAELISIVYQSTAASSVLYQNNTSVVYSSSFSQPTLSGTHYIGTRNGSLPFSGYIAEILVYSKTVSNSERATISQYLGKKWGISVA
jgi:hypothetical protein